MDSNQDNNFENPSIQPETSANNDGLLEIKQTPVESSEPMADIFAGDVLEGNMQIMSADTDNSSEVPSIEVSEPIVAPESNIISEPIAPIEPVVEEAVAPVFTDNVAIDAPVAEQAPVMEATPVATEMPVVPAETAVSVEQVTPVEQAAQVEAVDSVAPVEQGAQVEGVAPTATATPVVSDATAQMATSITETPAATSTVTPATALTSDKKGKGGLIAAIIIIAIVVLGGLGAVLMILFSTEDAETLLNEGVINFINTRKYAANIEYVATEEALGGYDEINSLEGKAKVTILEDTMAINGETSMKIVADSGNEITMSYGIEAYLEDGGDTYVKLNNIKASAESYLDAYEEDSEVKALADLYLSLIEKVDGNWYRIDAEELSEYPIPNLSDEQRARISEIYARYPFLTLANKDAKPVKTDGVYYIDVTFNKDIFSAFLSEVSDYIPEIADSYDFEIAETITLGIKGRTHEIVSVKGKNEDYTYALNLSYNNLDATKPTDAKNINVIEEELESLLMDYYDSSYSDYGYNDIYSSTSWDSQRRRDMTSFVTAVTGYQANNNGKLPINGGAVDSKFIGRYICGGNGGDVSCDAFTDPDGTAYSFQVESSSESLPISMDHIIHTYTNMQCNTSGNGIVATNGSRDYAFVYYLEEGSILCVDNQ